MARLAHGKIIGLMALAGAAAAFAATYWMPLYWTSEAIIDVRADDGGISDYVRELVQRALPASSLAELIRDYNLYPKERSRRSTDDVIQQMRKDIKVRVEGNAFRVEFSYSDPAVSQHVANKLLNRFVEANILGRSYADLAARRIRFSVTNPADFPRVPYGPNRLGWASVGLAGGVLVGAMAAWFLGRRRAPANA